MTDRARVLFVVHYPTFGGPQNQALRLHGALGRRGWDQVVLLPAEPGNARGRLEDGGVPVDTTRLGRLRAVRDPRLLLRTVRDFRRDVGRIRRAIRIHDIQLVMIGGLVNPHAAVAARLEGLPLVWQIVDTRAPVLLRRALVPFVLRLADSILCTGTAVADAHPGIRRAGRRLLTFFPPVDTERFRPDRQMRERARAELGLGRGEPVVGMVGNVNPQKGHRTFVRAAARLRQSHPEARFVILGASYPQHEAYKAGVLAEAETLGLLRDGGLRVIDPADRVAELASALDVFWLTSDPRSEGIPTVVGEAMALSIPVVATEVGSVREAVHEGQTGYVVDPFDADAIARTTSRILDDDALRQRLGERAREHASERFGVERCADVHIDAFELARRHARERARRGG